MYSLSQDPVDYKSTGAKTKGSSGSSTTTSPGAGASSGNQSEQGIGITTGGNINLNLSGPTKAGNNQMQDIAAPLGDPLHLFGGSGGSSGPDWNAIQRSKLSQLANQSNKWAKMFLNNYLTGKLPPDMQAQLDLLTSETNASIQQTFKSLGLSGSTMEASTLAYAQTQIVAEKANMLQTEFNDAMEMFGVDLNALGISTNLTMSNNQIAAQQQSQNEQAIASIGAAIGTMIMMM